AFKGLIVDLNTNGCLSLLLAEGVIPLRASWFGISVRVCEGIKHFEVRFRTDRLIRLNNVAFLSVRTYHRIQSSTANLELHALCYRSKRLRCYPLIQEFCCGKRIPNKIQVRVKFSCYVNRLRCLVNGKLKCQIVCHFLCFLRVDNSLSS